MGYPRKYTGRSYSKPIPATPVQRLVRSWSPLQHAIFNEVSAGTGNLQVDAYAGTGKTSTVVEAMYYVQPGKSVLFVAFNKSIQVELSSRIPSTAQCCTLHALGLRSIVAGIGKVSVDNEKLPGYIKAEIGDQENWELREQLRKAVSLAKGYLAATTESIDAVMDKHGVETDPLPREKFIALVLKLLAATKADRARVDFDDMVWFPVIHALHVPQYDVVFVDESQDLNECQISLALKACRPGGRIISVGDEHQAIYGFRGADSNAIENIVNRCASKRLPLSVTYRCARSIVKEAQTLVPGIEAAESAEDGMVTSIPCSKLVETARPGDFILSRTNAPLISWCLEFIKQGIPANIQGRDLGKQLAAMVKKSKASSVVDFMSWLENWRVNECMRLSAANRSVDLVNDKAECLNALCEGVSSVSEILKAIEKVFTDGDDKARIMLSSTHKAKGLERDRVFVLRDTYHPSKGREEANLLYVAISRARHSLYYISGTK